MRYTDSSDMRHDLPTTRVLLIDDESRSADLLSDMLSSEPDIMVQHQPSPVLAEQTARSFQPSIILVDLRMPGIDGFEVIRRLKAAPCAAQTPVLMVSSIEAPEQKAMGFAVGASDYLVKWPDRVELLARIRAHSRSHALAQERDGANAALRDSQEQLLQRTRELLATQVELQQAKKMEAIGNLTGGIAHDMNNMLQIISGNLQLLRMALKKEEALCRRIDAASEGVRRGAELSSQLLAFACKQPLRPCAVDVAATFRDIETGLYGGMPQGIRHELVAREGLWPIRVDPRQFSSALQKLIANAQEAMPDGGSLRLCAENVELPQGIASAGGTLAQGQYVRILVTDSGIGMSADVLELAFEPFFSTKPNAKGPGLGLSTAFGFVRQSGGHIALRSEPGKGTTVTLHFPRAAEEVQARHPHGAAQAAGGTDCAGTILVVDDEDMVRAAAVEVLQDLGYRVLQAADGEHAVGLMRSGIGIDLVFTDVVMPGPIRGIQVFEAAQMHLPQARVLFASGYPQKELMRYGLSADDVDLLHKPYRLDDMARKVSGMLSRAALDAPQ